MTQKVLIFIFFSLFHLMVSAHLEMPNETIKIVSDDEGFALISIPKYQFNSLEGETIIIDNITNKPLWKFDEYLNHGLRIFLLNEGNTILLVNRYKYINSIPSNPEMVRIIRRNQIDNRFSYFELFGAYFDTSNTFEINSILEGYYYDNNDITLVSTSKKKITISIDSISISKLTRANRGDLRKAENQENVNSFSELEDFDIILRSEEPFFDKILYELNKRYSVSTLTDKESIVVAFYLTLAISSDSLKIWECSVIVKNSSSYGFSHDEIVENEIVELMNNLQFEKVNPFGATQWNYSVRYFLK